jgi:hypothetical protein
MIALWVSSLFRVLDVPTPTRYSRRVRMKPRLLTFRAFCPPPLLILLLHLITAASAHAVGVTVITHGYDSDVNGWITAMADDIPIYPNFPGTNYTIYTVTLTTDGTDYYYQWERDNGSSPSNIDSGEIIVKLDWSQMAGGSAPYDISTYTVANIASYVLLQTNTISDLGGHALVEFPVHLIGHSRGGSLMSEMSLLLGTNGLWVDHLTTLDPHPFNNDGNVDPFFPTDAPVRAYANVFFADDYWQDLGNLIDPTGEPVAGAYIRQLTSLPGGYNNTSTISPDHSNDHLWYHGTVSLVTPTSDGSATITTTERQAWWVPYEEEGTNTGFVYSLIGGANRLSAVQPPGAGYPAVHDGVNQFWNFGAGLSVNRTSLTSNNGGWPNLIKLDRTDTNQIAQGQTVSVKLFYQWARPATSNATLNVYLDNDWNPLNTNQTWLWRTNLPGSSTNVNAATFAVPLAATNASPGWHSLFATITGGGYTRYLYAPEPVEVLSSQLPPALSIARAGPSQVTIGVNGSPGQTIILEASSNLANWQPLATNTLTTARWVYTNSPPAGIAVRFYRALLAP